NLGNLPKEIQGWIDIASTVASLEKVNVYLVGGFVRDLLLGAQNFDLDIVVEQEGIKFAREFAKRLRSELIIHQRFATATLFVRPHLKIDVATVRKECYPKPASLPEVSSGCLREDLFRRDFTINAMAISIGKKDFGSLIDYFSGKEDLRNKKIRVLHPLSFIDDPTRILRAIRFEMRYGFGIEPKTLGLLKDAVGLGMLNKLEPQRLRDELILIFKEKEPLKEISRIDRLAGFNFIKEGLSLSGKTRGFLSSVDKQVKWYRDSCQKCRHINSWLVYLGGLLDSCGQKETKNICRKFALRKGEEKILLSYKGVKESSIRQLEQEGIQAYRVFSLLESLSYEAVLLLRAKYNNAQLRKHLADFLHTHAGVRIHINGMDLKGLGIASGPLYQKIFRQVLKAKLNGLVGTKEEELALVKKIIRYK
ncbi:MAG: poly(A) polymerase, partial [Candidatus Omnitrophota bacterium]